MRRLHKVAVFCALGVTFAASVAYGTTQRRIRGIITSVDPANVTISPLQGHRPCVTGRWYMVAMTAPDSIYRTSSGNKSVVTIRIRPRRWYLRG